MAENPNKFYSSKQEKLVAKELGGYPIKGSGARPCAPGDVKAYDWLVECKTHTKPDNPIFFDIAVWKKIKDEAMGMSKKPVLIVDDGSQSASRTWCLCRRNNVNLNSIVTTDLPNKVRKNITCKHDALTAKLKSDCKGLVVPGTSFYTDMIFEATWEDEAVVIMPLRVFKEIFEK